MKSRSGPFRSVFTEAVIDGLSTGRADADNDGVITAHELFVHVQEHVRQSGVPQTPTEFTPGVQGSIPVAKAALWHRGADARPDPFPVDALPLADLLPQLVATDDRGLCAPGWPRNGTFALPLGRMYGPEHGLRETLTPDLSGGAAHVGVVGGMWSGKTTVLRTLMCSLTLTHTPLEARIYGLHGEPDGLSRLAGLPHVGRVADYSDPDEVREVVRGCGRSAEPAGAAVRHAPDPVAARLPRPAIGPGFGLFRGGRYVRIAAPSLSDARDDSDEKAAADAASVDDSAAVDELAGRVAAAWTAGRPPGLDEHAGPATATPELMELLGVSDPYAFDVTAERASRTPERFLRAPIGVDLLDRRVDLDVKSAAEGGVGPHGLLIGTTGAGKSEFLRTMTLSLAMTHSSEELNFVLVDFKSGATFTGFDLLPHVSAVLTNLQDELRLVERMDEALRGEVTRRQELLRAAGNFTSRADYEKARRHGAEGLPRLPALFVVVDEFADLLKARPECAELFITLGKVGRALGIQFLLATMRLEDVHAAEPARSRLPEIRHGRHDQLAGVLRVGPGARRSGRVTVRIRARCDRLKAGRLGPARASDLAPAAGPAVRAERPAAAASTEPRTWPQRRPPAPGTRERCSACGRGGSRQVAGSSWTGAPTAAWCRPHSRRTSAGKAAADARAGIGREDGGRRRPHPGIMGP